MAVSKGTLAFMAFSVCCQNSWAMFLHSGFMTLERRSCLFRILRIVIQQRRPEPLLPSLLRAQSVLRSFHLLSDSLGVVIGLQDQVLQGLEWWVGTMEEEGKE